MEIKVGDKVRVSSKLPKIYERFGARIAPEHECKVVEIDDDMALLGSIPSKYVFLFPLKYLIKVEDEDKAKYGIGDKVRVLHSEILKRVYIIIGAEYREKLGWYYQTNTHEWYPEIDLEPYAKPTEAISQEEMLNEYDPAAHSVTPAIAYYDAYTADLAKEIVLKIVGSHLHDNKPQEIGKTAVEVAKSVVEELKKK